jgi:hypothetical protein
MPETGFRVHETDQSIDAAKVFEVLRGDLAAYRVRGFVPPDACRRISENFWSSTEKVPRPGDGDDGVEGYLIGASHYGKPTLQYLEEARRAEKSVNSLYAGTFNPGAAFKSALASVPGESVNVRAASLNGLAAGDCKAIHWTGSGKYLLEPHDDLAQLRGPEQRDFEIQQAVRVLAVNIYAEVPAQSGQVQIWNVEPDDETRADLDLTYVGYPYPPELLSEYPSIIIPVETGDLCVFNGNLVHGVLRGNTMSPKKRLLITFFMTLKKDNDLIWWT